MEVRRYCKIEKSMSSWGFMVNVLHFSKNREMREKTGFMTR